MKKSAIIISMLMINFPITVNSMNPIIAKQADSSSIALNVNADFVSRYIWRGMPLDQSANIQPYASITYKDFSFGAWGSYSLANPYAEIDLNLSYSISNFTLTLNDYYNEDETDLTKNEYFKWSETDTTTSPHALEGCVTFNGTDNLPLSISAATFFYGNDKDTATNKNYYSTYFELGYEINIGSNSLKLFLGGTLSKGYYANKAAIVNTGVTASREIKISDSFSIPVTASFIINPNAKDVFFVFGMTF